MNKDFSKDKLLSLSVEKQMKVLYDLATFIEEQQKDDTSSHFIKLKKYHDFLTNSCSERMQMLNKEFRKIRTLDYQFQIYLMNLERALGQSKKEYEFIKSKDGKSNGSHFKLPIICLLDSVRSAHNVGAMIRNAECFGVSKVLLTGLSPTPDHPQVAKTAMGCAQLVNWEYQKDALKAIMELKKDNYEIWSIETGENVKSFNSLNQPPSKVVLIFGHEQFGVSNDLIKHSDQIYSLDMRGQKNSLNVSVAQGIILNHLVELF